MIIGNRQRRIHVSRPKRDVRFDIEVDQVLSAPEEDEAEAPQAPVEPLPAA